MRLGRFQNISQWIVLFGILFTACSQKTMVTPNGSTTSIPAPDIKVEQPLEVKTTNNPKIVEYSLDSSIPEQLSNPDWFPKDWVPANGGREGNVVLGTVPADQAVSRWIYVLVSSFPQVLDEVSKKDLISAWQEKETTGFLKSQPILVDSQTQAALSSLWGKPGKNVQVVTKNEIYSLADKDHFAFAIIPFEDLEPSWKIIHIDSQSPVEKHFDDSRYPLIVYYGLKGATEDLLEIKKTNFPESNLDPKKMTILTMTGTTALVRALGEKMEKEGMRYPAEGGISHWFWNSDFVHISNEASFSSDCPNAQKSIENLQFCSRPEYIELLDYIQANIIELTGNHIMDWGAPAFKQTLTLYQQHHMKFYGGGINYNESLKPLKIDHNGNKIAFIGCNQAGPEIVWALENEVGNAHCDFKLIGDQIQSLISEGYLPIVTIQYEEGYDLGPTPQQRRDFDGLAEKGAVIVSGSQAHSPQGIKFIQKRFVHYGLGNLFFDMMRNPNGIGTNFDFGGLKPVAGVRVGVIDRHIFYNGKYIQTELLTTMLENYAQLRPLTADERRLFLTELFKASGW